MAKLNYTPLNWTLQTSTELSNSFKLYIVLNNNTQNIFPDGSYDRAQNKSQQILKYGTYIEYLFSPKCNKVEINKKNILNYTNSWKLNLLLKNQCIKEEIKNF